MVTNNKFRSPFRLSNILCYIFCILFTTGTLIGTVILSKGVSQDIKNIEEEGVIVNTTCVRICFWGCETKLILTINYTIDNINYTSDYSVESFDSCSPIFPENNCCRYLIGSNIHLDVSKNDYNNIIIVSTKDTYNIGDYLTGAIFCGIGAFAGLVSLIGYFYVDRRRYRAYTSIS